jgi:xanthine dehydrogenase small subunit
MSTSLRSEISFARKGAWQKLRPERPREMLLDHIRLREGRLGTKEGCNEGDCGACTVVLRRNGLCQAVNSCILLTAQIDGAELITVEDIATDSALHPVQEALVRRHGSQCGFCTPGIVMSLYALYENTSGPLSRAEVLEALQGNLCRCTGYRPIVDAMLELCAKRPAVPAVLAGERVEGNPAGLFIGDQDRFIAAPKTEAALADLLLSHPDALIVSGATDVGLWITKRLDDPQKIVLTGQIEGFEAIKTAHGRMTIGAGASHAAFRAAIAPHLPDFDDILRRFGSAQVRNSGSVGGNIANGSPIGDLAPCLIALGATLHLRSGTERRELPLEEFFIAYGRQDRRPSEFVAALSFALPAPGRVFKAFKLSKRPDEDISSVLLALAANIENGRLRGLRIACGGMAGTPKRALATETALEGIALDDRDAMEAAIAFLAEDFQPLTDMRASAAYRMEGAKALLRRALIECAMPDVPTRLDAQLMAAE